MRKSILDVLLERSTASIYLDLEGLVIEANGNLKALVQNGDHNLEGRRFADLLEPAYRGSVADIIDRCLLHGRQEAVAFRFSGSREMRQLLFTPKDLTALNWPDGAALQVQDLTSALRTHDISLLSHELFNAILNDIGEGIIVLDPNLKITHINDFASRLLQIERAAFLDGHVSHLPSRVIVLTPGDDAERIFAKGLEYNKVARIQNREGNELCLLVNYYPVKDAPGRVSHVVITLQDITKEQETAEKIQRINRKLQEKVRELSVLNKLSEDFNSCTDGKQLYPRITATIVCGLGFHDTAAVLSLKEDAGHAQVLRSFFGVNQKEAEVLAGKPNGFPDNKLIGFEKSNHPDVYRQMNIRSAVFSPVIVDGMPYGYLNVFNRSVEPVIEEEETLLRIISENLSHFVQRRRAERQLKHKVLTLTVLKQISDAFQQSKELEQIAYVFLTGVTAEQGLGFNRALLFLVDEDGLMTGKLAVGPSNPDEASRIWNCLRSEDVDFGDLLTGFEKIDLLKESELNRLISTMTLSPDKSNLCQVTFDRKSALRCSSAEFKEHTDREFLAVVGFDDFAIAPLLATDEPVGILLADNKFTGEEIRDEDLRFLDLVTNQAQAGLESYSLYWELQSKVESLKLSNTLLQEHRTRLADLERLSALGEMAASVAHEIRNPLVSIGGFARSLLEDSRPGDPNRKFLNIICQEVDRLEGVVTNLLTYAKPIKPNFRAANLRDTVHQTVAMIEPEFSDAGVRIITRLDRKAVNLWIDPDLIKQALLNIMNNALHAMPDGGKLHISTKMRDEEIQIGIRDSGAGIQKEHLDSIFEPFFTTRSGGVGLGLAIVNNIIKSHGGKMKVRSWLGRGTTFHISLPVYEDEKLSRRLETVDN